MSFDKAIELFEQRKEDGQLEGNADSSLYDGLLEMAKGMNELRDRVNQVLWEVDQLSNRDLKK